MSIFTIKLIAMIAMLGDHVGHVFGFFNWDLLPFNSYYLRWIGRLSFPIYAFCIVNGWQYTRNKGRYFGNLCLCAIASQFGFTLAFYSQNLWEYSANDTANLLRFAPVYVPVAALLCLCWWYFGCGKKWDSSLLLVGGAALLPMITLRLGYMTILAGDLNVLYTLALGVALIALLEKLADEQYKLWEKLWLLGTVALAVAAYGINADYGTGLIGLLLILGFYLLRKHRLLQSGFLLLWAYYTHYLVLGNPGYATAMVLPAMLLLLYNDRPGPNSKLAKALFYWFYPVHLLLIGACNVVLRLGLL